MRTLKKKGLSFIPDKICCPIFLHFLPSIRTVTFTQHLQYKKKTLPQKWQKYTEITVNQQVSLQDSLKNFHKYIRVPIAFLGHVATPVIRFVTKQWRYQARTLAEHVGSHQHSVAEIEPGSTPQHEKCVVSPSWKGSIPAASNYPGVDKFITTAAVGII